MEGRPRETSPPPEDAANAALLPPLCLRIARSSTRAAGLNKAETVNKEPLDVVVDVDDDAFTLLLLLMSRCTPPVVWLAIDP